MCSPLMIEGQQCTQNTTKNKKIVPLKLVRCKNNSIKTIKVKNENIAEHFSLEMLNLLQ